MNTSSDKTPPKERKPPPRKKKGQGRGHRTINGIAMDVRSSACYVGETEKSFRGQLARGLWPHHFLRGRIVCLKNEMDQFLADLPGVSVAEAKANVAARRG